MLDLTNVKVPIEMAIGMKEGCHSSKYDGDKFLALMDAPTRHFYKWIATALTG